MPPKTITVQRTWITKKSTISTFTTHDGSVTGYTLEPPGPCTLIRGLNKRIPAGTYKLIKHSGTDYKNVFKLYNNEVPQSRGILIHQGSYPHDTSGCLLVGANRTEDFINGSLHIKLPQINKYINKYYDICGVQVVILDFDTDKAYQNSYLTGVNSRYA